VGQSIRRARTTDNEPEFGSRRRRNWAKEFPLATFKTREQAVGLFSRLFQILLEDEPFTSGLRSGGLSLLLVQTDPDFTLFVDPDGVRVDEQPYDPAIRIKMSCDTADSLWRGKLLMPVAIATGKARLRGSVAKVLEFVPLLHPAFDQYPELAASVGVT
jgi:putative sterol carrier protein